MTTINVKTFNGAVIGPHDVTINIDGIDYTAVISSAGEIVSAGGACNMAVNGIYSNRKS